MSTPRAAVPAGPHPWCLTPSPLPPSSPTEALGPRFMPTDDTAAVPELQTFPGMLPGDGGGATDEAELRELLSEMRGSGEPGGGGLPSLCDVEPTTGGWASGGGGFGGSGGFIAPGATYCGGPVDTFQVADTAGTPFHFPQHPPHHVQYYMAPPMPYGHPHPGMVAAAMPAPSPWNMGPPPPGFPAFPPAAYYAPMPAHMAQPMPFAAFPFMAAACAAAAAAPHMAGAAAVTSAGVVPTATLTTSSYRTGSATDGGSSGDKGGAALTAAALAKPRAASSNDSLQVVPDAGGVLLMGYHPGGGLVALRAPGATPPSTRAACLERYRKKKAVRSYGKHIRYHMRKVNADKRPRVKGRFIKSATVAAAAEVLNNGMDVCTGDDST